MKYDAMQWGIGQVGRRGAYKGQAWVCALHQLIQGVKMEKIGMCLMNVLML